MKVKDSKLINGEVCITLHVTLTAPSKLQAVFGSDPSSLWRELARPLRRKPTIAPDFSTCSTKVWIISKTSTTQVPLRISLSPATCCRRLRAVSDPSHRDPLSHGGRLTLHLSLFAVMNEEELKVHAKYISEKFVLDNREVTTPPFSSLAAA